MFSPSQVGEGSPTCLREACPLLEPSVHPNSPQDVEDGLPATSFALYTTAVLEEGSLEQGARGF